MCNFYWYLVIYFIMAAVVFAIMKSKTRITSSYVMLVLSMLWMPLSISVILSIIIDLLMSTVAILFAEIFSLFFMENGRQAA